MIRISCAERSVCSLYAGMVRLKEMLTKAFIATNMAVLSSYIRLSAFFSLYIFLCFCFPLPLPGMGTPPPSESAILL